MKPVIINLAIKVNPWPQAWKCHDILLKHAKAGRKGVVCTSPVAQKKLQGFLGIVMRYNVQNLSVALKLENPQLHRSTDDVTDTIPMDFSEIPQLDVEDMTLSCKTSKLKFVDF